MEQWQLEAIKVLLDTPVKEVEEGQRVYVSPDVYGKSLYHLIDKKYDGIQVEQVDIEEKWNKRINFAFDELPSVLAILLKWHLERVQAAQEQKVKHDDKGYEVLDDHPF